MNNKLAITTAVLALCFSSCNTPESRPVRTFADLEAAVAVNYRHFQQSQLTSLPQQGYDNAELSFSLFFELPLRERVAYIMDSFATEELDGEYAERMFSMLSYRTKPRFWWGNPDSPTAEDRAYTHAIFQIIGGYSESQVRNFCGSDENYDRFRKHLRYWRRLCKVKM